MSEETNAQSRRDEVEMMLPFYVTGRLDHADADQIGDYLKRHPEVASQLGLIGDERDSTVATNAVYANRPVRSFDRIAAMIGKAPVQPAHPAGRRLDWIRRLFDMPSSPALGWIGAAAAVVIVMTSSPPGRGAAGRIRYLTLPAVRPPTRCRSISANRITTGKSAMTEAANSRFQCCT